MRKKTLASLLLCFFFSGCTHFAGYCPVEDLTWVITFESAQLQKNWHLKLEDSCVDYDHGIAKIHLNYSSQELLDLDQSRVLVVDLVEGFSDIMENHYSLAQEVNCPPFTAADLDLLITFESFFGRYVDQRYCNQIRMREGVVTYFTFEAFDTDSQVFHKHCEYYENTRMIVQAQEMAGYRIFDPDSDYPTRPGMRRKKEGAPSSISEIIYGDRVKPYDRK